MAIVNYARAFGLDVDMLKRIIWRCDRVLITYWKAQDEAEKRRREAETRRKSMRGARP